MVSPRPGPIRWLRYVYGARLPDEYRPWVLHDATARTWVLRFALRVFFEALPWLTAGFLLLVFLTPLPAGLVLLGLLMALVLGLFLTLGSADELAEVRLAKHGFPPNTGKEVRKRRGGAGTWP
ncbi:MULTISPECIES: DUF5313 family protein [unclassified Amycolatopsis]|uniref:DUF5313 family protein n=1 Tax=unclassified Amycolatopsis TaxID=2618356 RepID=UPI001C696F27|nr:DUF5313 family protein [Amycolatopsis sp. DSM 110486]QYN20902.1 DUF5313 domain-containing protein [Amycolatopsis sp. DSM 110486]